jgi:hypothetical protein
MAKSSTKVIITLVTVFEEEVATIKSEAYFKVKIAIYKFPTIITFRTFCTSRVKLCLSAIEALLRKVKRTRRQVSELIFSRIPQLSRPGL